MGRIISTEADIEELNSEYSLRPKYLDEYIGQNKVKENLKIFIEAAKRRNEPLDHLLLYGPPGLGKTTLASIVANEMGVNLRVTSGPAIEKQGDLAALLTNLQEGDVLFIDEIHRLNRQVEEVLYPAMEDGALDIIIGKGPSARSIRLDLPHFTLIGATTRAGQLSAPLRDRFGVIFRLEMYTNEQLSSIVKRSADILNIPVDEKGAMEIASRSRGTPRIANRLLKRSRDFAQVKYDGVISKEAAVDALERMEIDNLGLDNIDRVISIIRGSANVQIAKESLIAEFALSEAQAQAIVDMRLRALTGLERSKLEAELKELHEKIKEYKAILADKKLLLGVIKTEISEIADKYGDDRRTSIGYDEYDISMEDLIPDEPCVIARTNLGYVKRMTPDNFKSQHRGGKGIKGMQTIDDDYIKDLFMTTSHHVLTFFTNTGRAYKLKAYEIPEASRTSRGTAIINLLQLAPGETITAVVPVKIDTLQDTDYLFMATKKGIVKKTPVKDFANIRKTGIQAINLREDDELIEVKLTDDQAEILMVTMLGQCIRFKETDVRPTGRSAMGVIGMSLMDEDEVVGVQVSTQGDTMLIVSENGMGKRTDIDEYTVQHRGGKGVKCYKITEKTGNVVGAKAVDDSREVMLITTEGIIIRLQCSDISNLGRITSGVKLINLDEGIKVATIAKVRKQPADEDGKDAEGFEEDTDKTVESED